MLSSFDPLLGRSNRIWLNGRDLAFRLNRVIVTSNLFSVQTTVIFLNVISQFNFIMQCMRFVWKEGTRLLPIIFMNFTPSESYFSVLRRVYKLRIFIQTKEISSQFMANLKSYILFRILKFLECDWPLKHEFFIDIILMQNERQPYIVRSDTH
jgi:hypothetical protein